MAYERTIMINASPAAVWAVIFDVEKWPEWTPTTLKVVRDGHGPLVVGSTAMLTLKGRRESEWRVTEVDPGRSFTWDTAGGVGLRVAGVHTVELAEGGSRVTLSIVARGPAAPLMSWLVARMSKANVDLEAESLKAFVEKRTQES